MQVVLSLPGPPDLEDSKGLEQVLFRKVCGIALLVRVIATAWEGGGTSFLVLHPKNVPESWLKARLKSPLLSPVSIHTLALDQPFDPENPSHWQAIQGRLEPQFLWLPWNFVTGKRILTELVAAGESSERGARFARPTSPKGPCATDLETPAVVITERLKISEGFQGQVPGVLRRYLADASLELIPLCSSPGCAVRSGKSARLAERELVRRSGKEWDGIYSKFNRRLCRPLVRWLSKTPITPNMVTLAGLPVAFLSGYWFSKGYWSAYVVGAFLYFVGVLFDEMDGMLARTTFRESAFGCWLESFVDYVSYFPAFIGMAIGLSRQYGHLWLVMGGLLLFGTVTTSLVAIHHRRLASRLGKPAEYLKRYYRLLEADSGNIVSHFVRRVHFFIKKGVLCHYLLIFSILGGIKIFFALAVFGSNAAWMLGLYTRRVLRPSPSSGPAKWQGTAASLPTR